MKAKNTNKADVAPAQSGQHTPETLIVCQPYTDRDVFPIGYESGDGATHIIGEINSRGGTIGQARSLADQIVKRYNIHPELLEALKAIVAHWRQNGQARFASDLATDAIEAISKVEGIK